MTYTTTTIKAEIRYDDSDFETRPYVVVVNGVDTDLRFNTFAKAEGAIAWHTKNNSF